MKISVRHPKDFLAGLLFIAFGGAAAFLARHYPLGTSSRMGPGYFPVALGVVLLLLGVVIALRALVIQGEGLGAFAWRSTLLVLASVVAFGAALRPLGLIGAIVLLIGIASLARPGARAGEVAALSVALAVFAWLLFVVFLELPFPVLPE